MRTMLDICSGIGGFSLAGRWAGYTTVGFVEIDPWCRRVLAKNFPGVPIHDDLKTFAGALARDWLGRAGAGDAPMGHDGRARADAPRLLGPAEQRIESDGTVAMAGPDARLDLITGGYPCQPFSLAGKRLGAADDRHLWPFIAALVADLNPRRCLFENVYGHVSMGLDAVLADLESLGYACGAVVVPACAVGAPHRRDRVWILGQRAGVGPVADAADAEWRARLAGGCGDRRELGLSSQRPEGANPSAPCGRNHVREVERGVGDAPHGLPGLLARSDGWSPGPGVLNPWAGNWEAGCPRTQERERDRVNKLKAMGNAIVPQVAYAILSVWDESECAA